ncbi:hypothetical protein A2688_02345 [Candidatus Daviesbacteria bacterium RIFCSPHIGHO2_01_FULL_38_8]|nr:MAG: hypothetical protein A2688_02345 [Candidatus Daviesbacteria bacterium RIFCSPHIGHO2_01_FULL_38_8]
MRLGTQKTLEQLKPVLKDPNSSGPDPVYYVFYELTEKSWANNTIISPGKIGEEFPKTFGHYHPDGAPDETYHLVSGDGVLLLQKKHVENGKIIPEIVDEVFLAKAKPGDEIVIPKEYGHSWSNVGNMPLISFDDWRTGHTPSDYEPIEKMQGMAYYLVEENGAVKAVPNPNYKNLPDPVWSTAEEFNQISTIT